MPVSVKHQESNALLYALLHSWLDYHPSGRVYHPPLQVKLTLPDGKLVSREPDIVVILNDRIEQLRENYFEGAPSVIAEVVSPSSRTVGSPSTRRRACLNTG